MDFNLPEELQMLKDTVRKFVDKELIPIEMHTIENMELKPDIRERLEKKTKEMGLWMFDVPEEYGGGGLGSLAQVLVWEELARTVALPSRGQGIFGPEIRPILYALNDEQKKRFLDPIRNGEKKLCFMQTEPDAGSRPGFDENPRRASRRLLHRQRHQALYHRRRRRGFRPAHGGDRSGQGRAWRHFLLHGRHEDARA